MNDDIKKALEAAESAVRHAQGVRKLHRRRTRRTSSQREIDIRLAQERIQEAMRPLRSRIARFPYNPVDSETEQSIREASQSLQRERRKLHKMAPRKERNDSDDRNTDEADV